MKVKVLSQLVAMLAGCSFAKMESNVKVKAHKAYRELKALTADYDDAVRDAAEKFKPEGFDELHRKVTVNATVDEALRFNAMMRAYNADIEAAVAELGDVEVVTPLSEGQRLTEDEFYSVAVCNSSITLEQVEQLRTVLC